MRGFIWIFSYAFMQCIEQRKKSIERKLPPPRIEKYVFGSNSAEKFALNSRLQQMARLFLNLSNLQ